MMLTVAIEQKIGFFQRTDASLSENRPINSYNQNFVSTSEKSTAFGRPIEPIFPALFQTRPAYEWVIPSCATSSADLIQALLSTYESALETSREKAEAAVKGVLVSVYELDGAGYGRSAAQEVMLFIENNLRHNRLLLRQLNS